MFHINISNRYQIFEIIIIIYWRNSWHNDPWRDIVSESYNIAYYRGILCPCIDSTKEHTITVLTRTAADDEAGQDEHFERVRQFAKRKQNGRNEAETVTDQQRLLPVKQEHALDVGAR